MLHHCTKCHKPLRPERVHTCSKVEPKRGDKFMGLYDKFRVERTDGQSAVGEAHDGCLYFVLDLTHDPFAIPAMKAYADACRATYAALATDLDEERMHMMTRGLHTYER